MAITNQQMKTKRLYFSISRKTLKYKNMVWRSSFVEKQSVKGEKENRRNRKQRRGGGFTHSSTHWCAFIPWVRAA